MNILDLCDLHVRENGIEEFSYRWNILVAAIRKVPDEWTPDVIVVPGDFVCTPSEKEFFLAQQFIQGLSKSVNVSLEKMVICNGNHDAEYFNQKASLTKYCAFYNNCGFVTKNADSILSGRKTINKQAFLYLNSCTISDPENFDRAFYSLDENRLLKKNERTLFAVMHHQPGLFSNKSELEHFFHYCSIVFCGHLHPQQPVIERTAQTVIVTGIAVTPHSTEIRCGCQIIKTKNGKFEKICTISSNSIYDFNYKFEENNIPRRKQRGMLFSKGIAVGI